MGERSLHSISKCALLSCTLLARESEEIAADKHANLSTVSEAKFHHNPNIVYARAGARDDGRRF
jgi:hypothetical protein